jgi:hypothetical protein
VKIFFQKIECENLWIFVKHFNELVNWAVSEIVKHVKKVDRGNIL